MVEVAGISAAPLRCAGKNQYRSFFIAEKRAAQANGYLHDSRPIEAYKCYACYWWHIGHAPSATKR